MRSGNSATAQVKDLPQDPGKQSGASPATPAGAKPTEKSAPGPAAKPAAQTAASPSSTQSPSVKKSGAPAGTPVPSEPEKSKKKDASEPLEDKVTPELIRKCLRDSTVALKCTPVMLGSALGILRLGDKYGKERLERASYKASRIGSPSYRTVKTMLKQRMESVPLPDEPVAGADTSEHLGAANVRGRFAVRRGARVGRLRRDTPREQARRSCPPRGRGPGSG